MDKKTILECLINHFTDGNKSAFAKKLGVKPQTINTWLLRNTFDIDLIYSKCAGISASWLLTGDGEMLAAPAAPHITQTVTSSSHVTNNAEDQIVDKLMHLIDKKDDTIRQQAECIGKLRAENEQLKGRLQKSAAGAHTVPTANAV